MATEPELAPLFDFLCEHSPSKSRVMALIGPHAGPRSLTGVLTCKDKRHAYQAVQLLRRALACRDTAVVAEDLHALASALPDAPASSLRTATAHAASGTWPAPAGTTFCPPDENLGEDEETQDDETATSPESRTPYGARLKDLPSKVVRIAHLREFHVTDEDALIRAAMDEGWEPLPASELDEDDPRDLIGAVMTLTESGDWIMRTSPEAPPDDQVGQGPALLGTPDTTRPRDRCVTPGQLPVHVAECAGPRCPMGLRPKGVRCHESPTNPHVIL